MIAGLTAHTGGKTLGRHLARVDDNEAIRFVCSGLVAANILDAIDELEVLSFGCRTAQPLVHIWASPSKVYSDHEWGVYWAEFEEEFSLVAQPFLEVSHDKIGVARASGHRHRVYLRVRADRTAIPLSHSRRRIEKLSRLSELATGERLIKGGHNRAVHDALVREGRLEEACAINMAGLLDGTRPCAVSPAERAQSKRKADLSADEVWRLAYDAWCRSTTGSQLVSNLAASGLRIARSKEIVILTECGTVHGLRRSIANGGRQINMPTIKKKDLETLLGNLVIPGPEAYAMVAKEVLPSLAIVGLDRTCPLATPTAVTRTTDELVSVAGWETSSQPPQISPRQLTPAQEAALDAFDDMLFAGAREAAKQIRIEAEIEARQKFADVQAGAATATNDRTLDPNTPTTANPIRPDRQLERYDQTNDRRRRTSDMPSQSKAVPRRDNLDERLSRLGGRADLPTISESSWRAEFRARLAGLPTEYGARLRWVSVEERGQRTLHLKSGTSVTTMPRRAVASSATPDTVPIMIAHAVREGWTTISISGGTDPWRKAMVDRAMRAGLRVVNPELAQIVQTTTRRLLAEQLRALVENWTESRKRYKATHSDIDLSTFVRSIEALQDHTALDLLTPQARNAILRDITALATVRSRARSPTR